MHTASAVQTRHQGIARKYFGIEGAATPLPGYADTNVRIDSTDGSAYVLRISPPEANLEILSLIDQTMLAAQSASFATPRSLAAATGGTQATLPDGQIARLHTWVDGVPYAVHGRPPAAARSIGRIAAEMVQVLEPIDTAVVHSDTLWDLRHSTSTIAMLKHHVTDQGRQEMVNIVLDRLRYVPMEQLHEQVIHNDLNDGNLLMEQDEVVGVIDFGDTCSTIRIAELAIACTYAMLDQEDPVSIAGEVCTGYREVASVAPLESANLFTLILGRLATSVCVSASLSEENPHQHESESAAWDLLARLTAADMDAVSEELARAAAGAPQLKADRASLTASRAVLGPSLSLSYDTPLHIVRGEGQLLFDHRGRRYLDCVNNVCHVGHSNPHVVEAAAAQMRVLNTNTRYVHGNVTRLAERLISTLPEYLDTAYLVNSGSEANELAIRLARAATRRHDVACIEDGYHGNTSTLIDVSPYKFDGSGGAGQRDWVHILPSPDPYRNSAYTGADAGANYRSAADEILDGTSLSALIIEALPGCGGQLVPVPGVLAAGYDAAAAFGGLVIADEVQTGMGRVGTHFWAFQLHDVEPDIVTVGKPVGNGHPLAAVVTTRAIATAFDNGMEYFNTFGGNPVSAAVGNAVLDVIEQQDLQKNAYLVGRALMEGLDALAAVHPAIGDVRGAGLFIGIELVTDRLSRRPNGDLAHGVVEAAKKNGVLLSVDGPHHNVIKIKPPLVFTADDASHVVDVIDGALATLA